MPFSSERYAISKHYERRLLAKDKEIAELTDEILLLKEKLAEALREQAKPTPKEVLDKLLDR